MTSALSDWQFFLLFETFFEMLVTNIAVHLSFRTQTEKQHVFNLNIIYRHC